MTKSEFNNYTIIQNKLVCNDKQVSSYIGEIKIWLSDTLPANFLWCDGSNISSYPKLVAVLGGLTNTPDLRSKFIVGSKTVIVGESDNKIKTIPKHSHADTSSGSFSQLSGTVMEQKTKTAYKNKINSEIQSAKSTEFGPYNIPCLYQSSTDFYASINDIGTQYDAEKLGNTENQGGGNAKAQQNHTHAHTSNGTTSLSSTANFLSISKSGVLQSTFLSPAQVTFNNNVNFTSQVPTYTNTHGYELANRSAFIPSYKNAAFIIRYQ